MAISDRIQAIEQHLTDDYSVLTLAGADLTNVDKNIVNLKPTWKERLLYFMNNGTDVVWENWDKVVGEGTTITLNNTEEAPMKINLKGNTSQEGTPTPESPQDIHVVSGDNTIEITGKNQFDESNLTLNTSIEDGKNCYRIVGINTGTANKIWDKTLKENTQYTLSMVAKRVQYFNIIYFRYTDGTASSKQFNNTTFETISATSTAGKTLQSITIDTGSNGAVNYIEVGTIQLEEGTTATTYEAYQSASYPISLGGNNLFDFSNTTISTLGTIGTATVQDDKVIFTANGSVYGIQFDIKNIVEKNTTYTISNLMSSTQALIGIATGWRYYDGSSYTNLGGYQTQFTFTTGTGTTHILYYYIGTPIQYNGTLTLSNIQLEKGTKANSYTPYGTTPIELCKIGDYQDKIDKSSGKNLFDYDYISNYSNTTFSSYRYIKINGYDKNKRYLMSGIDTSNFDNLSGVTVVLFNAPAYSGLISGSSICYNSNHFSTNKKVIDTNLSTTGELYLGFYTSNSVSQAEYEKIVSKLKLVQLEEMASGDTPTSYEPYGTGWYLKKEIGKVVYTGASDESWNLVGSTFNWFSIRNDNIDTSNYTTTIKILCDYYKARTYANTINSGECTTYQNGVQHMLAIKNTDISSVENFKTWLSSNNTTVYYVLDTPTYTEITDSTLLSQLNALAKSYNNQTNISQENNDLPFIINATALEEMS